MTIAVDLGLKATKQTNKPNFMCVTSECSGETVHMHNLVGAYAGCMWDEYQNIGLISVSMGLLL